MSDSREPGGIGADQPARRAVPVIDKIETVPAAPDRLDLLENSVGNLVASWREELLVPVQQLQGQMPNIDRAMVEMRQYIVTLEARLNALAQHVGYHNLRITALREAAAAKGRTGSWQELVAGAQIFFDFIAGPPQTPAQVQEPPAPPVANGHDG